MDSEDLYGLPLERFTEERNALAKALRKQGQREQATAIAKLPKPSLAAWAVNQIVRTQKREVAALFDAGDALQHAQEALLAGRGDPDALRGAVDGERDAVEELAERARGLLSSEGHELTTPMIERVAETLHAAALDGDARAQVEGGCLSRELRHVGLGVLGAASAPARSSRSGRSQRSRRPAAEATNEPRTSAETRTRSSAQRRALQKAEAELRRQVQRATRELNAARNQHERALEALRVAEELLTDAQAAAKEAERRLEEASRDLR